MNPKWLLVVAVISVVALIFSLGGEDVVVDDMRGAICQLSYYNVSEVLDLSTGVYFNVTFTNDSFDFGCVSNVTSSTITILKSGLYEVYFHFNSRALVDDLDLETYLFINDSITPMRTVRTFKTNGLAVIGVSRSMIYLNSGDVLSIKTIQNSGGDKSVLKLDGKFIVKEFD